MLTDTMTINGLKRTPYITIAGCIGVFAFFILSITPLNPFLAILLMFSVNLSVSSPDVMIDGDVAEKYKTHPARGSDLQSLCWGSYASFSIIGFGTSGLMIHFLSPRGTFGVLIGTSLCVFLCGWFGSLSEKANYSNQAYSLCRGIFEFQLSSYYKFKKFFLLAMFVSFCAIMLSLVVLLTSNWAIRFSLLLFIALLVTSSVYFTNYKSSPNIAKVAVFIFLREALCPDTETLMFYWYTDSSEGPHFSPFYIGFMNVKFPF